MRSLDISVIDKDINVKDNIVIARDNTVVNNIVISKDIYVINKIVNIKDMTGDKFVITRDKGVTPFSATP